MVPGAESAEGSSKLAYRDILPPLFGGVESGAMVSLVDCQRNSVVEVLGRFGHCRSVWLVCIPACDTNSNLVSNKECILRRSLQKNGGRYFNYYGGMDLNMLILPQYGVHTVLCTEHPPAVTAQGVVEMNSQA